MMPQQKNKNPWIKRILGIAAGVVIVFAGIAGFSIYRSNYAVASVVSLDVNPSIEILVNQKERVLEVNALNDDARKVIQNMDLKGSSLNVTVNALIGSMLRNGYITELSNSILISVSSDDVKKGAALQEKLMQEINALLQTDSFSGAVLGQTLNSDAKLKELSEAYGITLGKAQLIQRLVSQNPLYSFESLVPLSINELNLLTASAGTSFGNIESIGHASDKDYIGIDKAQSAALAHAGVSAAAASDLQVKLDYEDGIMVYEVEFRANGYEYEYEVNAKTGAIVKSEMERDNGAPQSNGAAKPDPALIGEAKAKQTALSHAGVKENDIREYSIELDTDDGVTVYDIDFKSGNFEYEYEINAKTGAIVKSEKERDD